MPDQLMGRAEKLDQPAVREVIVTDAAPAAVGPYSQGICVGDFIFTAGQLGIDPVTSRLVEGGVQAQTRQALTNLQAVLKAVSDCQAQLAELAGMLEAGDEERLRVALRRLREERAAWRSGD